MGKKRTMKPADAEAWERHMQLEGGSWPSAATANSIGP
jgi:hypothetical protein